MSDPRYDAMDRFVRMFAGADSPADFCSEGSIGKLMSAASR